METIRKQGERLVRDTQAGDEIVAIPVDRDTRRRCFVTARRYACHLFDHFMRSPGVFEIRRQTIEEAAAERTRRAGEVLTSLLSAADTLRLPAAHILYKKKCFTQAGEWQCGKPHEHVRLITAAPRDKVSRRLKTCSRAFKTILDAAGHASWPVRDQSSIPLELREAHARLEKKGDRKSVV